MHLQVGDHGLELGAEAAISVRTNLRSLIETSKSLRAAAIVSRQRQKSVIMDNPCLAVRNSTDSSRVRDSCWPRNLFSRKTWRRAR